MAPPGNQAANGEHKAQPAQRKQPAYSPVHFGCRSLVFSQSAHGILLALLDGRALFSKTDRKAFDKIPNVKTSQKRRPDPVLLSKEPKMPFDPPSDPSGGLAYATGGNADSVHPDQSAGAFAHDVPDIGTFDGGDVYWEGDGEGQRAEFSASDPPLSDYTNKDESIRHAIEDADSILRAGGPCSKFFGKYALAALGALDKLLEKGIVDSPTNDTTGIRMFTTDKAPTEISGAAVLVGSKTIQDKAYRIFQHGVVNAWGPFFNLRSPARIGGFSPITRESRVTQILHELAHLVYKPDGKGGFINLIANDSGSGTGSSVSNTNEILESCRDEIKALGKKK